MRRLKYAMIGGAEGSFIGPIHRMAIRMDDLADLVAGSFSRNAMRNKANAAALRIDPARAYADWRKLIAAEKDNIDFVAICTTNETHYAIAKAALEAGLDVLCEKPLSLTVKEAETLGKLAEKRGRVLGIPFTYTGYPMIKLARDLVKNGEIGKIDKINLEYVQGSFRKPDRRNTWKMDPELAGPSCVVADIGVHAFTLIEYVSGLEVESLLADLSSYGNTAGLDDDATVLMRMASTTKATLVTSKVATGEENGVRLHVYGNKASIHWDQESPNYLTVKYPTKPDQIFRRKAPYIAEHSAASLSASRFPAGHHEGFVEAFANIYDGFVAAVHQVRDTQRGRDTLVASQTNSPSASDFPGAREGIRSMRFVEACLKSNAKGNRWVKV